jgi:hypothetical protein
VPEPIDPRVIGNAPISVEFGEVDATTELARAYEELGYLQDQLLQTRAELDSLKDQRTVEQVRAGLIGPYTSKVFWFVVWYCIVVGIIVVVDGVTDINFDLKESTIGIIAGSTAVSVIGLIGMVISGLFGGKKH